MSGAAPRVDTYEVRLAASTILATNTEVVCEAPYAGEVTEVTYTPEANITGADSPASRSLTLVNKGADGNGTTVMATLAFIATVDATDFNEAAFTLSAVADATDFVEGDILAVVSEPVGGTGMVDPGGLVQVKLSRT